LYKPRLNRLQEALTLAERRAIVRAVLRTAPDLPTRIVSEMTGASPQLVSKLRKQLTTVRRSVIAKADLPAKQETEVQLRLPLRVVA
jgi:hypothetical protein